MTRWRDRPLTQGMWLATCLVIGLVLVGFTILWTSSVVDSHDAKNEATRQLQQAKADAARQREGRAVAIDFLCGGLSGVEAAGKKALRGELPGQRGQGLPAAAIREYNATISRRIILQARVNPKGILDERTGRLNCDKLGVAAKASHP